MTRQRKTPKQRAQEQLDVAGRAVKRLETKARDLQSELFDVEAERDAAVARRDHLAAHPDLKPNPGTSTTPPTGSSTDTEETTRP